MKKYVLILLAAIPMAVFAQKEIKPSLSKAEKALRANKLDEAKSIIDVTVGNTEFMNDKKGNPSKNAAKAYYLKALIYFAIDTTSVQSFKSLAPNARSDAKAAFDKAHETDKSAATFINDANGVLPLTDDQIRGQLAQAYLDRAVKAYQNDKDYKKAFDDIETVVFFMPNDTTQLMNAGVYFGPAADDYDKALTYIDRYYKAGGKHQDAYIQEISIYYDKKKDYAKTLDVISRARKAFPKNTEFVKYELNIYLTDKKYDKARSTVKEILRDNPEDKESFYLLGQLNAELGNLDSARLAYKKATDLDPNYFEAQLDLAKIYLADALKIKAERDKLGISPADIQKRKVLFDQLQKQYTIALPYWERALQIRGDDEAVLYTLDEIYTSLVMDDKAAVIKKKMKQLGYTD